MAWRVGESWEQGENKRVGKTEHHGGVGREKEGVGSSGKGVLAAWSRNFI